ncbi:hydroxycinnamoyltransferase 1-like [Rhodamnia argentea]|uniref:Hydroxycinnamoyltransferase 1-like n=1 Tax=Rhodamnia argentea TaxID=178133 RepID=A0A8B8NE72_9MYRT|nr:hydroxycinnamoyltransferase 1-like [Rhodamnia argentea]
MADSSYTSRVKVQSTLTAVSSKPVGAGQAYKLSVRDHAMGGHSVHLIFYYRDIPFGTFDLDPLRVSLSETLSLYPPATGRLARDGNGNWEVKWSDAGIRVLQAKVGASLDEWLRSADGIEERDLTVWEDMPQDPHIWSPFRIQISEFEGGGVAMGLSCTHLHADLTTAARLFQSWSQVHRRVPVRHPPRFPDSPPAPLRSPTHPDSLLPDSPSVSPPSFTSSAQMSSSTFKFSDQTMAGLVSEVSELCPDATPFDVVAALFWTRIIELKQPRNSRGRWIAKIAVDTRGVLREKLPLGFFGNAMQFSPVEALSEDGNGCELWQTVKLVHDCVLGIQEGENRSASEQFESRKEDGGARFVSSAKAYGPQLTIVSMEHMAGDASVGGGRWSEMYEAMFVDGERPIHVSVGVGNAKGEGLIMVVPEEGLGRSVTVVLPEEEAARLHEDQEVLKLEPTVILSGQHNNNSRF